MVLAPSGMLQGHALAEPESSEAPAPPRLKDVSAPNIIWHWEDARREPVSRALWN